MPHNELFIPFAKPNISQAAIDEMKACLESGWLTTGPRVKQFENNLKDYLHSPFLAALSSGTAGLHLALLALNLQPEDEVITTPLTFAATANTIVLAGAKPVFVDVDSQTYNINVNKIEAAITPNTRAIMPVHFAGCPVDLDPLYAIAKKHNCRVIEDAAHAIGASYKKQRIGSFGDTQIFSFHPNKNMTTGEGGCVATTDKALIEYVNTAKFHGIECDPSAYNNKKNNNLEYDIKYPGFKYNMMDMQALLGIHQLERLDSFIKKRHAIVQHYEEKLKTCSHLTLPQVPGYEHRHAWHLYTPLINTNTAQMSRNEFISKMRENNIGIGMHYQAVHLFSFYKERYDYKEGDFPIAESIAARIVSLPLFPTMKSTEQEQIIDAITRVFRNRRKPYD